MKQCKTYGTNLQKLFDWIFGGFVVCVVCWSTTVHVQYLQSFLYTKTFHYYFLIRMWGGDSWSEIGILWGVRVRSIWEEFYRLDWECPECVKVSKGSPHCMSICTCWVVISVSAVLVIWHSRLLSIGFINQYCKLIFIENIYRGTLVHLNYIAVVLVVVYYQLTKTSMLHEQNYRWFREAAK